MFDRRRIFAIWSWHRLPRGVPEQVSPRLFQIQMNRNAIRALLLALATVISLFVIYLGYQALTTPEAPQLPRLTVQGIGLVAIGGVCLLGVVVSALIPQLLQRSPWLRRVLVCVALALPTVDLYAFLPGDGVARALSGQVAVSLAAASLVALAIATGWLDYFRGGKN
jgi:hypothetical protein